MKITLLNLARATDFHADPRSVEAKEAILNAGHEVREIYADNPSAENRALTLNSAAEDGTDIAWLVLGGFEAIDTLPFINWPLLKKMKVSIVGTSDATHLAWMCVKHKIPFIYAFDIANVRNYYHTETKQIEMITKVVSAASNPRDVQKELLQGANLPGDQIVGGHTAISSFMCQLASVDCSGACLFLEYHHPAENIEGALYWFRQIALLIKIKAIQPRSILLGHNEIQGIADREFRELVQNLMVDAGISEVGYVDHYMTAIPIGCVN